MSMFLNRVKKNLAHFRKWARRAGTEAYRVYDKDIPEYPFSVDVYGPYVVVYEWDLHEDETSKAEEAVAGLAELFGVDVSHVFLKTRRRIRAREEQYERLSERSVTTVVEEQGLKFKVNLSDYLDTGLFLDHRKSRAFVRENAAGKRILNLFCYTGSVSVYAAAGGASEVCSVDMSNTYIDWARENFELNGFEPSRFEFVRADVARALEGLTAARRKFDLIFVDPPSFSNSKKMAGFFDVQDHHAGLLLACRRLLAADGRILFSNNNRKFKMDEETLSPVFDIENFTARTLPDDFRNQKIHNSWLLRPKESAQGASARRPADPNGR